MICTCTHTIILSSLNAIFKKRQVALFCLEALAGDQAETPFVNMEGVSALVSRNPGFLSHRGFYIELSVYEALSIICNFFWPLKCQKVNINN
jgi:hypothetical protein